MARRRYGEDEVREIFTLATTGGIRDHALPNDSAGMTLEELQRIGQEAGIEPARVAQAAGQLDARGKPAPVRRSFGLPIGVSRVVDLPRAPTDREWEQLISEFRSTFGTQGRNGLAVVLAAMSALFGAVVAASGDPGKALLILGMFAGMALFAFGANLIRLPRWARERERQMETLAAHAVKLLSKP